MPISAMQTLLKVACGGLQGEMKPVVRVARQQVRRSVEMQVSTKLQLFGDLGKQRVEVSATVMSGADSPSNSTRTLNLRVLATAALAVALSKPGGLGL